MINRIGQMLFTISLVAIVLMGCSVIEDRTQKIRDLPFTVVPEKEIPEVLAEKIQDNKGNPFKMTYADGGDLYICIGYGSRSSGGYSVTVDELYLTSNAIYVDTTLLVPEGREEGVITYPYVCIKLEYLDKRVVFE
ncbi:MAG: protease complex subunit PrcB family protein [Lachnospiraceae bacterium]